MATDAPRGASDSEHTRRATRRQFFRHFGRQTANSAGSVLAGVETVRRNSRQAIDELLAGEETPQPPSRHELVQPAHAPATPAHAPATDDAPYRSPYRFTGQTIEILDQRSLPHDAPVVECVAPSEVAAAIRGGLVSGGPVLGQVAAYTLVLALAAAQGRSRYARDAALDAAAGTLRAARPSSRAIAGAVERMREGEAALAGADEQARLTALTAAADRIAAAAAQAHAELGRHGADVLADVTERAAAAGRPLAVLMHGDQGPLVGGQVGLGIAIVQALMARELPVHSWLTDGAPMFEGRRAAWQLRQLDLPHTLIPDTAVGWLLDQRSVDVVLLRAEWVCANGDIVAPIGSRAAAQLARAGGVEVYACAPTSLFDTRTADGRLLPTDVRLQPPNGAPAGQLQPLVELVPARLLSGIVCEQGVLGPPLTQPPSPTR